MSDTFWIVVVGFFAGWCVFIVFQLSKIFDTLQDIYAEIEGKLRLNETQSKT